MVKYIFWKLQDGSEKQQEVFGDVKQWRFQFVHDLDDMDEEEIRQWLEDYLEDEGDSIFAEGKWKVVKKEPGGFENDEIYYIDFGWM
jgi:hypothetical protein